MPALAAEVGTVRFGAIANPTSFGWYRRWAALAEDAGFTLLATGDSQSLWADSFVTLAVGAGVSRSARLAVTVSNHSPGRRRQLARGAQPADRRPCRIRHRLR